MNEGVVRDCWKMTLAEVEDEIEYLEKVTDVENSRLRELKHRRADIKGKAATVRGLWRRVGVEDMLSWISEMYDLQEELGRTIREKDAKIESLENQLSERKEAGEKNDEEPEKQKQSTTPLDRESRQLLREAGME